MRPAALAGRWYPADPDRCRDAIKRHVADADDPAGPARGLIGPHAGWAFSGDCAGRAYGQLKIAIPRDVDLTVIFGSHRGVHGLNTVFRGDGWQTPLGPILTDAALATQAADALGLKDEPSDPGPRPDNAVELHLPFIHASWPQARLLMIGVQASAHAVEIGRVIGEQVRDAGRQAVFVGSTDLTHYGPNYSWSPHGTGPAASRWVHEVNDRGFIDPVLEDRLPDALDHALTHRSACCPGAVLAAVEATRAYAGSVHPALVSHTSSDEVQPSPSFVGYASLLI